MPQRSADPPAGGAFAEVAVVPATDIAKLPSPVPFEQAAGIPTTAGTALQALFEVAGLKSGQTVLIHAGAGGVTGAELSPGLDVSLSERYTGGARRYLPR